MEIVSLKGFQDLDALYSGLLADVKSGAPIWEEIIGKGGKLFAALRTTVQASNAFLDSIQRLADLASKTTGGSKEIGAHFTRLCMRQKRLGTKVKTMGNQLITCMVNPLSTHMDEWKKTLSQIEKEHNREAKRARGDLKRALSEATRLKRKLSKQGSSGSLHSRQNSGTIGRGVGLGEPPTPSRPIPSSVPSGIGTSSLKVRTDSAIKNLEEKVRLMEDLERASIRRLMLEERGRYCFFFNCLRPVLETETSLLGEITTLRELFTALSAATQDPSQLLDDAESVLAHTGVRADGHSISPNGPLRSPAVNEVEAFASAVDAIMSSKQRQKREEATLSLASESICSTSSGCSGGNDDVGGSGDSPHSSQMSMHSAGSSAFALNGLSGLPASQHQMAQILRQPRAQTDVAPRSASVGRPAIVGTNQRIVSSYGADDVILRRPTNFGATVVPPRQRPLTTTTPVAEPAGLQLSASSTLGGPSPNQRNSTCTLQLDEALLQDETPRGNTRLQTDDEAGEDTASGTAEDEVSDDGVLSEDRRRSTDSTPDTGRPPFSNTISNEHRSLSRAGDLNTMLYPDQSLPPPVYTNLNKLTHAAQRKFSMSTAASPNADGVAWQAEPDSDNISIASAPHTQPDRAPTNGIYSVPESPNRPSFSTSSSISRPRGSSVGMEDPFSVEMDELDRMVTELHSLNIHSLRPSPAQSRGDLEMRPIAEAGDSMFCIPTYYSNRSFGDLDGSGDEVFVLPSLAAAPMRSRLRAGSDTPMNRTPTNALSTTSLSRVACGRSSLPPPIPYRTSSLRRPAKRKDV